MEEEHALPKIMVLGIGGSGCNTVQRLNSLGVSGAYGIVAVNTDKQELSLIDEGLIKVLIGKSITQGMGTKGAVEKGAKSAENSRNALSKVIEGSGIVFITTGMGGGTGTGAVPVIADVAKQSGAMVCCIVTYPFDLERSRVLKAEDGIVELAEKSDSVIVINNNRLVELIPGLSVNDSFKVVDELVAKAIKGIVESVSQPSLINLGFDDLKASLSNKGIGLMAVGEAGSSSDRIGEAVQDLLKNTLLDVDVSEAKGLLLQVIGGPDLSMAEAKAIGELLSQRISPEASVAWSARVEEGFDGKIEAIAFFAGIVSPFRGGRFEKESGRNAVGTNKYSVRGMDGKLKKGIIEI